MKRLLGGALVMLTAIGVQFAMVVDLVAPSLALALGGYAALFVGAFVAVPGALARRRRD